ncbi:MAG: serine protease [Anaeroplasma sp.]|nr:serine protease [Anaeroplasma sp.]
MKNKKIYFCFAYSTFLFILCMVIFYCMTINYNANVFSNIVSSIVELQCQNDEGLTSYGTAVCIDNEGIYITNAHVLQYTENNIKKNFNKLSLRFTNEESYFSAEIINVDEGYDLALIKSIEKNNYHKSIKFSKSDSIKTGDNVYACGNSQNQGISISKGLISKSRVVIELANKSYEVIATDAYFSEGCSGGALINKKSELIGITTFRLKDSIGNIIYGMGYAIPIDIVKDYIKLRMN